LALGPPMLAGIWSVVAPLLSPAQVRQSRISDMLKAGSFTGVHEFGPRSYPD
jgi:hypothetical protein